MNEGPVYTELALHCKIEQVQILIPRIIGGTVMEKDVWVLAEHFRGEVNSVTFEMLDEGRTVANRLNGQLAAVVFGHHLPDAAATLGSYGADVVYMVDHPLLVEYTTDAYVQAMVSLIRERNPFLILLPATVNGRDLAPRIAARLEVGLASDCTMVRLNDKGLVEATRSTHRDKVYQTVALTSSPPMIATLRPGAVGLIKPDSSRQSKVKVKVLSLDIDQSALRTKVLHTRKADPETIDISEAELVVSGGRGIGTAENWRLVEELATALGASVGGSRMAMDQGWIPTERMVGQTGKSVSSLLYLALGISGANEHMFGIREAKNIVAITKDPGAPILKSAGKAVVGDVNEIVPVLIRKIKEMGSKNNDVDLQRISQEVSL